MRAQVAPRHRQLDLEHAVDVRRARRLLLHVDAELDHALERAMLDLELLVHRPAAITGGRRPEIRRSGLHVDDSSSTVMPARSIAITAAAGDGCSRRPRAA